MPIMSSSCDSPRLGASLGSPSSANDGDKDSTLSERSYGTASDSRPTSPATWETSDGYERENSPGKEALAPEEDRTKLENLLVDDPFQSEENRILFEAIDFIQSSDLKHHVEIPEVCSFSLCSALVFHVLTQLTEPYSSSSSENNLRGNHLCCKP